MTIDERIEKMERQLVLVRWVSCGLIVGVVLCLAAWFFSETRGEKMDTKHIRAKSFVLEDDNGKLRAMLADIKDIGTMLTLMDENGKLRAGLGVLKDGLSLVLYDENEKSRVSMAVNEDGPALSLSDENGKTRALLGRGQTKNSDGVVISLPESSLILFGADEKVIWSAP